MTTGTPFDCTVTITVPPSVPDRTLIASFRLPTTVFHIAHTGGALDADSRSIAFPVDPKPGTRIPFTVSLVVDRAGAGARHELQTVMLLPSGFGADQEATATVRAERVLQVDLGFAVLPFSSLTLFLLMVGVSLTTIAGVWVVRRRRPLSTGVWWTTVSVVMLWAFLATLPPLVENIRSYTSFGRSVCTVLDRGDNEPPLGDSGGDAHTAAVRYTAAGEVRTSTGFDLRGTVSSGADALSRFAIDRQYACWFDPSQPSRVVLRRGISTGAIMALPSMALLLMSLRALRGGW